MECGEIILKIDSISLYEDRITFRDEDGGYFNVCAYGLEKDFVSKLLDAISEYQENK